MAERIPLHRLMKIAGHKKPETTMIYLDSAVQEWKQSFIEEMA